jgi:hypothetical protein
VAHQSIESFFAQVNGTLEAIVLACTALTATHPEKEKILALLASLSQSATASDADNEDTKSFKLGIRTAVATISKGVENARLAEQVSALKHETGTH